MSTVSYESFIVARKDPEAKRAQYMNSQKGWATDISEATTYKTQEEAGYAANVTKGDHVLSVSTVVTGLYVIAPQQLTDLDISDIGEYLNGKEEAEEETPF